MMSRANGYLWDEPGWHNQEYEWEDLYDLSLCVAFEYKGRIYEISCEEDSRIIDDETGEELYKFNSKEEFYNLHIFGRPIKDVIDESYLSSLW